MKSFIRQKNLNRKKTEVGGEIGGKENTRRKSKRVLVDLSGLSEEKTKRLSFNCVCYFIYI